MPEFRLAGRRLEVPFAFVQHFVQAEVVIFINIPLQQTYPRLQKTSPRIGVVIAYRRELLSRSVYGVVIERVIFPKPLADIFSAAAFEGQDYSAPVEAGASVVGSCDIRTRQDQFGRTVV